MSAFQQFLRNDWRRPVTCRTAIRGQSVPCAGAIGAMHRAVPSGLTVNSRCMAPGSKVGRYGWHRGAWHLVLDLQRNTGKIAMPARGGFAGCDEIGARKLLLSERLRFSRIRPWASSLMPVEKNDSEGEPVRDEPRVGSGCRQDYGSVFDSEQFSGGGTWDCGHESSSRDGVSDWVSREYSLAHLQSRSAG